MAHKFDLIKHSVAIAADNSIFPLTQEDLDKVYTFDHPEIQSRLSKTPEKATVTSYLLPSVSLPPVMNQGDLGECFAFAGCGIEMFFDRLADNLQTMLSPMFLGYWSRYICGGNIPPTGDDGSTIIATMQAMQLYGLCLAATWPYIDANENIAPSPAADTEGKLYEVGKYFAIKDDDPNKIANMKQALQSNLPLMGGWDVDETIENVGASGIEPYVTNPLINGQPAGHARWIIGFDNSIVIPGAPIPGAFRVRNSWDITWGDKGDSWVSYQTFIDQETNCMGITQATAGSNNPPAPVVTSDTTVLTVPEVGAIAGKAFTITAKLVDTTKGLAVPNQTIIFGIDGTNIGSAKTDSTGIATYITSQANVGTYTITAVFVANGNFQSSAGNNLLEVVVAQPSDVKTLLVEVENFLKVVENFLKNL